MLHIFRNGKIITFVLLLVLAIGVGTMHNRTQSRGSSYFPEDAVRVVIKPFQVAVSGIGGFFSGIAKSVRSHHAFRKENDALRDEVKRLNMELVSIREEAAEARRLRAEIGLKEESPEKLLPVRIISRDPSEWFVTATLDRGRTSGIRSGQAVITHRGLIGQVFEVSPNNAQVRAITDGSDDHGGVGAMVQRSRVVGICMGQGSDLLQLTYLSKDADIKNGDIIVTSGQGGVVPKGLPIGRVISVKTESGGFMKSATIRPSVKLGQTEEAFVVIRKVE
ncbi:MAG: rod shape-determining protein MreC [Armatimonadota bacterium]